MNTLPVEVVIRELPHGVCYELPRRSLGGFTIAGKIIYFVGLAIGCGALVATVHAISNNNRHVVEAIFEMFFLLPFWMAAIATTGIGALISWGSATVEFSGASLIVTDKAGVIRWKRKRSATGLRRFDVAGGAAKMNGKPVMSGPLSDVAVLVASFESGKPMLLLLGYPRGVLQGLANDLARRIGETTLLSAPNQAPEVRIIETPASQASIEQTIDVPQPAASKVRVEESAGATIITVPPAGVWRGSKGLFLIGVLWVAFTTGIMCAIFFAGRSHQADAAPAVVWLFVGVFEMIGFAMLVGAVNMGRRRAMFMITPTELKCAEVNVFGTKKFEWPILEITRIGVGPSGMAVNNRPVLQLQVESSCGRKGFFAGRDETELQWMAGVLRRGLHLDERQSQGWSHRSSGTEPAFEEMD